MERLARLYIRPAFANIAGVNYVNYGNFEGFDENGL
jgi:hypothetical protein